MERRRIVLIAMTVLVFGSGLAAGILLDARVLSRGDRAPEGPADVTAEAELLMEASQIIRRRHVYRGRVDEQDLAYGAIQGMVETLGDGGGRFLTPALARREENHVRARFAGIGLYVVKRDGRAVVIGPVDGSPAEAAGLQPGDVILAVDGEDVTGLRLDEIHGRIRGPVGTRVALRVLDAETGQVSVARMERADVRLDLVTWERAPEALAVRVRIAAFDEGVSEELETILREMEEETVKGLVLDLRNNTGGLVEEAVGVTSQFLAAGNVLLTTDSQGRSTAVPVRGGGRVVDTPMVVLVNGATGNAAEIVTGALQDHERATVVGTATVGGGAVMDQFTLSDGSVLLIPVEAWLTPDGRAMWPQGLSPDIEVPLPATAEPVIEPRGPAMTKEQLQGSGDTQLIRALELLDTGRHRAVAQRELVRLARPLASPADRRAACRDPAGAHGAGLGSEAGGSAPVRGAQQGRGS